MRSIFIFSLLAFKVCSGQTTNFYFSPDTFLVEKTYSFVNHKDTTEKANWKMKTIVTGSDTIFQTSIFNNDKPAEVMTEKVNNGNSKILTYTLFNNGKSSDCKILDSLVYKLNQKENEKIQWKVEFKDFNSSNIITLTKTRNLQSIVSDKQAFSDTMRIDIVGNAIPYIYFVNSIYEKSKGLISYKITRPNGQVKEFELTAIK